MSALRSTSLLLVALACAAGPSLAQVDRRSDPAPFDCLGFSKDGKYVAFRFSHIPPDTDVVYTEITLFDVDDDSPVGTWIAESAWSRDRTESSALAESLRQAQAAAQARLEQYGIDPALLGDVLYDRPFDPSVQAANIPDYQKIERAPSVVDAGDWRLSLLPKPVPSETCREAYYGDPTGFTLTLGRRDGSGAIILRDDRWIPRSRGCPVAYRIRRVVAFHGHVVVFLTSLTSPWESVPDVRHLAVGARIGSAASQSTTGR